MNTYRVAVKEIWSQTVLVKADSEDEAINKVIAGDIEYLPGDDFCYFTTLPTYTWDVKEEDETE